MITNLTYRLGTEADLPLIFALLREAATRLQELGVGQWDYWLDPPPEKVEWLTQGVFNREYHLAQFAADVAGMYRLSTQDLIYWGPQEVSAWYVHSLVVSSRHTGLQIGKHLLSRIESQARAVGLPRLRLDCHSGNPKLCRYYENLGFVKVGEKLMPHSLNNLYEKNLTSTLPA